MPRRNVFCCFVIYGFHDFILYGKGIKKSVIRHTIITDFIVIYNLIPLFCFLVGIPNDCINSSFLRLNQLTCETPSCTAPSPHKCTHGSDVPFVCVDISGYRVTRPQNRPSPPQDGGRWPQARRTPRHRRHAGDAPHRA